MVISLFKNKSDNLPRQVERTWAQLCQRFATPVVRQEKDGPLFSPARFEACTVHEHSQFTVPGTHYHKIGLGQEVLECEQRHNYSVNSESVFCKLACRRLVNVTELSMLVFDCDYQVTKTKLLTAFRKLRCAFALYSTHSHQQVTEKNPNGDERFRAIVPFTIAVPAADYPAVVQSVVGDLGFQITNRHEQVYGELDNIIKNLACIYYTPAKFSEEAPYEWHVEPGEGLDWRLRIADCELEKKNEQKPVDHGRGRSSFDPIFSDCTPQRVECSKVVPSWRHVAGPGTTTCGVDQREVWHRGHSGAPSAQPGRSPQSDLTNRSVRSESPADKPVWETYAERHAELANRIKLRGRRNSQGHYDTKCLAHGGKGSTSLCFNPARDTIFCNAGCTYDQILLSEGLPGGYLPDVAVIGKGANYETEGQRRIRSSNGCLDIADSGEGVRDDRSSSDSSRLPEITITRLHVICGLLLAHCLELKAEDEAAINKSWGPDAAYSKESISWPTGGNEQRESASALIKVCSLPTFKEGKAAGARLAELFDLRGVPGFFFTSYRLEGLLQGSPAWLLNTPLNLKPGALLMPYYTQGGLICGLRILRSVRDRNKVPWLLNSRGLPSGSRAVPMLRSKEQTAARAEAVA